MWCCIPWRRKVESSPPAPKVVQKTRSLASSAGKFTYASLDGHDDFRLLTLHSGSGNDAIRCTLKHESSDAPDLTYDALSYFCGPQDCCRSIEVNERSFDTTQNAYDALKTLRKPDEDITLWVDAVSIHQTDTAEKGSQVQLMSRIYSRASQVIVWLGVADKRNDKVFDLLEALDVAYKSHRLIRNSQMEAFREVLGNMVTLEYQDALAELFRRFWFKRLWVVQEIALARKVLFRCANREVTWDALTLGLQFLIVSRTHKKTTVGLSNRSLNTSFQDMHKVKEILDHFTKGRQIGHVASMPSIMYRYAPFVATKPADYVYGLLGILNETKYGKINSIEVEYHKTTAEIFTNAVKYCLAVDQTWDVFSVCDYYHTLAETPSDLDMPSWVPEFSKHGSGKTISFILGDNSIHSAGGSKSIELGTDYWYERDDSVLVAKGIFVDSIDAVSAPGVVDRDFIGWCRDVRELAVSSGVPDDHTLWNCWGAERPVSRFRKLDRQFGHDAILNDFQRLIMDNEALHRSLGREGTITNLKASTEFSSQEIECAVGWMTTVTKYIRRRRVAFTAAKRPTLVNRNAQVGDKICVLPGGKVPFVLRPEKRSAEPGPGIYRLIGDCVASGLMHGEALAGEMEEIRLV